MNFITIERPTVGVFVFAEYNRNESAEEVIKMHFVVSPLVGPLQARVFANFFIFFALYSLGGLNATNFSVAANRVHERMVIKSRCEPHFQLNGSRSIANDYMAERE